MTDNTGYTHSFTKDANWFLNQMSSRKRALPVFAHTAEKIANDCDEQLIKFIESHSPSIEYNKDQTIKKYIVPEGHYTAHSKLRNDHSDFSIFASALPKMAFVSIVSLFDAYLARLLKSILLIKPELLHSSGRSITFSELLAFGSFESAQQHFVEKEIETILRESHITQFEILEKRLGVILTKLPAWIDFIELTERRNLLVHADARVSAHYLDTCEKYKISVKQGTKVGDKLEIDPDYYKRSCACVIEIGLKLNQVIWRKILPEDLKEAEASFIQTTYDLLISKQYKLAESILELSKERNFAKVDAESRLLILINLAIAVKGQEKDCAPLLSNEDFSALSNKFKLANLVLLEKYEDAATLMQRMGKDGELRESHYREWPLFRWFRETHWFKSAFENVYGYKYTVTESLDETHTNPSSNTHTDIEKDVSPSTDQENLKPCRLEAAEQSEPHFYGTERDGLNPESQYDTER
ncbi:hypothetical protein [Pseudomonas sp. CFBP 13602]|uniref:hypothetical protein n=1 Tax=Pseudomonas sp. CFBP 13602 TaxID=2774039 RepID=UPI001786BBAB|nr:hypothetical protein [Pseudomonas sp. CFBP 13602]MBD8825343.1 hypothetical protein [Pseudomonas sp. CFBP 13602]